MISQSWRFLQKIGLPLLPSLFYAMETSFFACYLVEPWLGILKKLALLLFYLQMGRLKHKRKLMRVESRRAKKQLHVDMVDDVVVNAYDCYDDYDFM